MPTLRRTRANRGEFHFWNMAWLTIGLSIIYFGIMFVPPYSEIWEMKSFLQETCNGNWREYDETKTREFLNAKIKTLNKEAEVVSAPKENILIVREDPPVMGLRVTVTWTRQIKYPFLEKSTYRTFTRECYTNAKMAAWTN